MTKAWKQWGSKSDAVLLFIVQQSKEKKHLVQVRLMLQSRTKKPVHKESLMAKKAWTTKKKNVKREMKKRKKIKVMNIIHFNFGDCLQASTWKWSLLLTRARRSISLQLYSLGRNKILTYTRGANFGTGSTVYRWMETYVYGRKKWTTFKHFVNGCRGRNLILSDINLKNPFRTSRGTSRWLPCFRRGNF